MKKIFLCLCLLSAAYGAFAIDFGLGVDAGLSNQTQTIGGVSNASTEFIITASVILKFSDLIELTPFISFYTIDDNIPATYARTDFSLGAGLYFHFLRNPVVELSVGPKLWIMIGGRPETVVTDYAEFTIRLSAPVILDVLLIKNLTLRMSLDPFFLAFRSSLLNGVQNTYISFLTYDETSLLDALHIGVVFMF